jgi:DNA-binding winged helix-turn-helix (wHTH) protein
MRYRFAEFCLDIESGHLTGPDGVIALRRQTYRLLTVLVQRAPALLDRDLLLDAVWGHDALSPNVLPQTISELRQALGDSAQQSRLIETRPRRGYRLLPPVTIETGGAEPPVAVHSAASADTEAAVYAPDPLAAATTANTHQPSRRRFVHRGGLIAGGVAFAVLTLALLWWLRTFDDRSTPVLHTAPLVLALAPPELAGAPDWVGPAGRSLLTLALQDDPWLVLARGDGGVEAAGGPDLRWQAWMREALGAEFALLQLWQGSGDDARLNVSLIRLANGEVLQSAEFDAGDPGVAIAELALALREVLRLAAPATPWLRQLPSDAAARRDYFRGLGALELGRYDDAAGLLEQARAGAGAAMLPALALATTYRRQGRHAEAAALLQRLDPAAADTPLGLGLRLQVETALLDGRGDEALSTLAALQQLFPHDVDLALELAAAQLDAARADAAARTLGGARLQQRGGHDPRWQLLQARVAALRHDWDAHARHVEAARQLSVAYGHRGLELLALREQARALRLRGRSSDAAGVLEAIALEALRPEQAAPLRLELGVLRREQGGFDAAETLLRAAEDDFARLGARAAACSARIERLTLLGDRGEHDAAYAQLQQLGAEVEALGDPALLSRQQNALGAQAVRLGQLDAAVDAFSRAAEHARRGGWPQQQAGAWNNLAVMWAQRRRFAEAEAAWSRALEVFQSVDDRHGEALTLGNLAAMASAQGQAERGRELNRQALLRFRALDLPRQVARTAFNLGLNAERAGNLDEAAALWDEALQALLPDSEHAVTLQVGAKRVALQLQRGEMAAAAALIEQLQPAYAAIDAPLPRAALDAATAQHARLGGELVQARALHDRALQLRRRSGREDWVWASELDLLELDLSGEVLPHRVRARAEQLAERFQRSGEPRDQLQARLIEARALLRADRHAQAAALLQQAAPLLDAFADAGLAIELRRLRLLAAPEAGLDERLLALADEAEASGFMLAAWRCRLAAARRAAERSDRRADVALQASIVERGLGGLLLE